MTLTIKSFILSCLNDEEFWRAGGIPAHEKQYIKGLGLNEEQVNRFYTAMIDLYNLNREVGKKEVKR